MTVQAILMALAQAAGTPVTTTNPALWVTPGDYPPQALREIAEGTTAFRLAVDRSGSGTDCAVTEGSGNATLDEATCRLVRDRARFAKGVGGTYSNRVRWTIPVVSVPGASWTGAASTGTAPSAVGQARTMTLQELQLGASLVSRSTHVITIDRDGSRRCEYAGRLSPCPKSVGLVLGEDGKPVRVRMVTTTTTTMTVEVVPD